MIEKMVREEAIKCLKGKSFEPYEYRFAKKNNKIMWVLETITPIIYKEMSYSGRLMDITERKRSRVTASIGISIYPKDGEDGESLLKNADTAMYYAKEEGKNNFQLFSKDLKSQAAERLSIETNLRFALERNELSLNYQAKLDFKTGAIAGVEALLRWHSPLPRQR